MNQHFTFLCCTYGRPWHLEEAIQCFLNQDYAGPKEMLVYNTYAKQQLTGSFPNVRIINEPKRPKSLGCCRNQAIALAQDDTVIITADDDNIFFPNHISNYAEHFDESTQWAKLSHQFYMLGWKIVKIVPGACDVVAFRKSAHAGVGGYAALDCGEDRDFISKVSQLPGKLVEIPPKAISFGYGWGNSAYHVSGLGDARPGIPSGHDRVAQHTETQTRLGKLPTGKIPLAPACKYDYPTMRSDFLKESKAIPETKVVTLRMGTVPPYIPMIRAPLPKITLVYVYVPEDPEHIQLAGRFSTSYRLCPPGVPHETVIVCNGKYPDTTAQKLLSELPRCRFMQHDDSGWDIGAFMLASKRITESDFVVYCGGKTHFRRGGWMARMVEVWQKHGSGFYGGCASFEVSPHLNTSGFWCDPKAMLRYPRPIKTRRDRYDFEHGPRAMWRAMVKAGRPAMLVTWDAEYNWPDWRKPKNGFRRGDQSDCLTYFEHSTRFDNALPEQRTVMTALSDNITDIYFLNALKNRDFLLSAEANGEHFLKAHNFK